MYHRDQAKQYSIQQHTTHKKYQKLHFLGKLGIIGFTFLMYITQYV